MILNPKISKLIAESDSVYGLVVAVAKRSRELAQEAAEDHYELSDKAINLAIDEFADRKLVVHTGK